VAIGKASREDEAAFLLKSRNFVSVLPIIHYILSRKHKVSKDNLNYWEKGTLFFWMLGDTRIGSA